MKNKNRKNITELDKSILYANKKLDLKLLKLFEFQELRKSIIEKEEILKTEIMEYMGNNSILKAKVNLTVYWKEQTQRRVNALLLKKENPNLYREYSYCVNTRPFRLVKEGGPR